MNNAIKKYTKIRRVTFKNDIEFTFEESDFQKNVAPQLASNSMTIAVGWEFFNRTEFVNTQIIDVNDLEWYILAQPPVIRKHINAKRKRLKQNMDKEMTLEYCQSFVKDLIKKEDGNK